MGDIDDVRLSLRGTEFDTYDFAHAVITAFCRKNGIGISATTPTQAAQDVLAERQRQITKEGWTPEHDDKHDNNSMRIAAACYALHGYPAIGQFNISEMWKWTGWSGDWFKPKAPRKNLIRAAALLIAEIERLDRAHGIEESDK